MTLGRMKAQLRSEGESHCAAESGKKSKYTGLWYYGPPGSPGRSGWSCCVEPLPGTGKKNSAGMGCYWMDREPLFVMHNFRCEVEAALAHDLADLWLRIHQKGCTAAKLAQAKWNLPSLKLWKEENRAVGPLSRIPPTDLKKAQTKIRLLTNDQLPRLPPGKLDKLRQKRVNDLQRQRAEAAKRRTVAWAQKEREEAARKRQKELEKAAQQEKARQAEQAQREKERQKQHRREAQDREVSRLMATQQASVARRRRAAARELRKR